MSEHADTIRFEAADGLKSIVLKAFQSDAELIITRQPDGEISFAATEGSKQLDFAIIPGELGALSLRWLGLSSTAAQPAPVDERGGFEAWARIFYCISPSAVSRIFRRRDDGGYGYEWTHHQWVAWQARAHLGAAPESAVLERGWYHKMADDYELFGVKDKDCADCIEVAIVPVAALTATGGRDDWNAGYRAAMCVAATWAWQLYAQHCHHHGVDGLLARCKEVEQLALNQRDAASRPTQEKPHD